VCVWPTLTPTKESDGTQRDPPLTGIGSPDHRSLRRNRLDDSVHLQPSLNVLQRLKTVQIPISVHFGRPSEEYRAIIVFGPCVIFHQQDRRGESTLMLL